MSSRSTGADDIWRPFVVASLLFAISGGFTLGGLLFAARLSGNRPGLWWPAAAQAHGQIQVIGFAGLMVIGVGLHFLPRLAGIQLAGPHWARLGGAALIIGLAVRAISQPLISVATKGTAGLAARLALATASLVELAGAALLVGLLFATLARSAAKPKSAAMRPVLPIFIVGFAGFVLAVGVDVAAAGAAARDGRPLLPAWADGASVALAFSGFLIPIALAMSIRTLPLYLRVPSADTRVVQAGLAGLLLGLALRLIGSAGDAIDLAGVGAVLQALAIVVLVLSTRAFSRRRPLPRQRSSAWHDPFGLLIVSAYGWLLLAGMVMALLGLSQLGVVDWSISADAERHALGAGFVTLLIFGVGGHLLPGFARRPLRSRAISWVTLLLGNLAALLRVVPVLVLGLNHGGQTGSGAGTSLPALAGLAGLAALIAFTANLWWPRRRETP